MEKIHQPTCYLPTDGEGEVKSPLIDQGITGLFYKVGERETMYKFLSIY